MRRVSVFALPVSGVSLRHLEQTIALGETEAALRLLDWRLGLSWPLLGEGWPGARGRGRAAPRPPCPVLGDTGPVHVLEAKRTAGWPPSLSQLFGGSGFRGIGSDGYRARLTIKKKMIARRPVGSAGPCHARCSGARAALRGGGLVLLFVTFELGAPSAPRGPRCGGCSPPAASRSAACSAASTAPSPRPRLGEQRGDRLLAPEPSEQQSQGPQCARGVTWPSRAPPAGATPVPLNPKACGFRCGRRARPARSSTAGPDGPCAPQHLAIRGRRDSLQSRAVRD